MKSIINFKRFTAGALAGVFMLTGGNIIFGADRVGPYTGEVWPDPEELEEYYNGFDGYTFNQTGQLVIFGSSDYFDTDYSDYWVSYYSSFGGAIDSWPITSDEQFNVYLSKDKSKTTIKEVYNDGHTVYSYYDYLENEDEEVEKRYGYTYSYYPNGDSDGFIDNSYGDYGEYYNITYTSAFSAAYPKAASAIDNVGFTGEGENGLITYEIDTTGIEENSLCYILEIEELDDIYGDDSMNITYLTKAEFASAVNELIYYNAVIGKQDDYSILENGYTLTASGESIDGGEVITAAAENIYTDTDVDLSFDSSQLSYVNDSSSAEDLITSTVNGMSTAEKSSVKAKDQLAYLTEEAAARAAAIETEDDIVIDEKNTAEALDTVSAVVGSAESVISGSDVSVKSVRNKVIFSTSKSSSVSISKDSITSDVDVVEAVTPFGSFEFEPDSVSELTVDSEGTNTISVSFDKTDSTSKVTVKFPNVTSDGYKAVVDEDGNVIGGKYNPVTDELSAKIDESGVFTVVTNEKDFSDIKSQPAEVQNAIKKLASKGIIKGTSETEFSPDSPITRAEIAALIVRILDVDDPDADGGFTDVTRENWYFGSAGSSKRENIIAGYEDNTFRGTVVIPKVQITSVTARVLTNRLGYYSASESILNEFTDSEAIANWARSDIALATYANMVIRRTDGSFAPDTEMTRGDAAVILEKLFDKVW